MDTLLTFVWAISDYYPRRAHLIVRGHRLSLCGMQVHHFLSDRPMTALVCPECAISYTCTMFPAGTPQG
ncbi:hypothetical protein [Actinokineospora sp. UTMC 2448]|uniref:hypothetical protein n=1 Tax=Actinokineospora sp. UTMC 2448 TaxID=2268449 RepID=UPI002164258B|nr:hypothetical protein [Actinokineospora sp. UTMC 2448]UVS80606.1 hypothetical protein Actkin_04357 [Actinokineospora sp. UTMC 2448]